MAKKLILAAAIGLFSLGAQASKPADTYDAFAALKLIFYPNPKIIVDPYKAPIIFYPNPKIIVDPYRAPTPTQK
jgi:hypothetical protein